MPPHDSRRMAVFVAGWEGLFWFHRPNETTAWMPCSNGGYDTCPHRYHIGRKTRHRPAKGASV